MFQSGVVDEDVTAYYFMPNIDTEIFGLPLTGNIGVRVVTSEQYSTGLRDVDGDTALGAIPITDGRGVTNYEHARVVVGQKVPILCHRLTSIFT